MPNQKDEEVRTLELSANLIKHLKPLLLDLHHHLYPDAPSPEGVPKRASVALIIRIQPNYSHWPPERREEVKSKEQSQSLTPDDRINAFFKQDWVQHGDPEVLFIKRAARKGDHWTSHVALPGGRRDPDDVDDRAAAIREAWEEVGIDLSDKNAIATGNLPQRLVTSNWGKKALMTLCPYIFLVTSHDLPPLKLQPTEVASAHWVPFRALLSRKQRTYWYQDISHRTSKQTFGFRRVLHRAMVGDMMFAACHLVPSESKYCSSIAEFLQAETIRPRSTSSNTTVPLMAGWNQARADSPLLLWGLTLGVMGDFLDMLPPHNALKIWTYPTFTPLDLRLILWTLSYNYRKEKDKQLGESHTVSPVSDENFAAAVPGGSNLGELRAQMGSRSSATEVLIGGYYEIVRRAVIVSICTRASVAAFVIYHVWKRAKSSHL